MKTKLEYTSSTCNINYIAIKTYEKGNIIQHSYRFVWQKMTREWFVKKVPIHNYPILQIQIILTFSFLKKIPLVASWGKPWT